MFVSKMFIVLHVSKYNITDVYSFLIYFRHIVYLLFKR